MFYLVRSYFAIGADERQVTAGIIFAGQDLLANVKNGPRHKILGDATPEKGNIWSQLKDTWRNKDIYIYK